MVIVARIERGRADGREPVGLVLKRWLGETGELFRDPVVKSVAAGDTYHLYFGRPMVCFNSLHLSKELSLIPSSATAVTLHITDLVTLIDHTTATALLDFVDDFKRTGRGIARIVGLDKLRARSHAEAAMRVSAPVLAEDRAEALTALARVSLTQASPEVDPISYLERISLTHVGPIAGQEDHPIRAAIFRAATSIALLTKNAARAVRRALVRNEEFPAADHDMAWTSMSRVERSGSPDEIDKLSLSSHENLRPIQDHVATPDHRMM
jgi:hypothetical protein